MMTLCSGITVGFVLVYCLSYHVLPCVVIFLPILYLCLIIPLPEPPQDLLKQGHEEKAEKSFCFYKNLSKDPAQQDDNKAEFDKLRNKVLASGIAEKITPADFCKFQIDNTYNDQFLEIFDLILSCIQYVFEI